MPRTSRGSNSNPSPLEGTPTEGKIEQDLVGSEGGLHARGGAPSIDHIARPRNHRLGAVGAFRAVLNIVREPRTIGDPERDQPLDGHGPPSCASPESERERDSASERKRALERETVCV